MAKKSNIKPIGQVLMESLTAAQVAELLNAVLPSGAQLDRLLEILDTVDADLAATLKTITAECGAGDEARSRLQSVTSLRRDLERWQALWQAWEAHVLEIGDEEGKYASQEAHWEPPCFDGYALASDLEAVAERMLPLIDRVFEAVGEPDLFLKALARIEAGIKDYPEWMGAEYDDGCCFERHATRCILHWCWLACMNMAEPGAVFVENVLAIETDYDQICLDAEATIQYFAQLPQDVCLEVYNLLRAGEMDFDLDTVHSVWHRIDLEYQARFDSGRHLESCAAHLSENWRYGRPLVEAALGRGDWPTAESWLEKTFASLLGPRRSTPWFPESGLLLVETNTRLGIEGEQVAPLLELWAQAARRLGLESRASAADFQAIVFQEPENWEAVLAAYGNTVGTDSRSVIEPIWEQWKTETAGRSIRRYLDPGHCATWIHWLLDAVLESKSGVESFHNHVDAWLTTLKTSGRTFEKQWRWLALLTEDLDAERRLGKEYPLFSRVAFWDGLPGDSNAEQLTATRRQALSQVNAGACFPGILTVWKRHLHRIVPDPAAAHKSNYTWHATWAGAVLELNPAQFRTMIEQWRIKHNRRRNLWRDLKEQGLPV